MKIPPNVLLTLASLLWSLNFLLGKTLAGVVPAGALNLLRWVISLIIIFPIYQKELIKNKQLFLNHWKLILAFSFTGYFINTAASFLAVNYTTAINASFIASLNPILFAIISFVFFHDKVSNMQIVGIITSLFGVLWIIFKGYIANILSLAFNAGDSFMLLSVLSYAVYTNVLKRKGTIFPWNTLFLAMVLGGVALNIPYFIAETIYLGFNWWNNLTTPYYLSILAIGIFPSLLASYCWNTALHDVTSNYAAIFANLIPIFTTILSILFLGESIMIYQIIGGLLILFGVFMVTNDELLTRKIKVTLLKKRNLPTEE